MGFNISARRVFPLGKLSLLVGVGCAVVAGVPVLAGGATYTFTNVVDSTGPFHTVTNQPHVSRDGSVIVFGGAVDNTGTDAIYKVAGATLTKVVETPSPHTDLDNPVVNNAGNVTFASNSGVYSNGGSTTIANNAGPLNTFITHPSINSSGAVAFRAGGDVAFTSGIYVGSGGALTTIADTSGSFAGFREMPSINDSGVVAFQARDDGGSPSSGIYTRNVAGGATTTIAHSAGAPYASFGDVMINNGGELVFHAYLDSPSGTQVIQKVSNGITTTVASTAGPFANFFEYPAISDNGTVVFSANTDAEGGGVLGIYDGPDPVLNKVIKMGDTLFGHSVTNLGFTRGLTADGDIVFSYRLSNGVEGIAIAAVPEPAAAASLALVAGAMLLRRRRR